MTGIERLREFVGVINPFIVVCSVTSTAYDREHMEEAGARLRDFLADIADQIEREHAEDRESDAWVREHGGVDELTRMFQDADNRRVELCGALGIDLDKGWSEAMAAMRLRLMPEGTEWPMVDGKPVDFVTGYEPSLGVLEVVSIYSNGACQVMSHDGIIKSAKDIHIVKPKVLDADGAEIREGDRVWSTHLDEPHEWIVIDPHEDRDDSQTVLVSIGDRTGHARPEDLTHRAPVLAADGEPLEVGQTVYHTDTGREYQIHSINDDGKGAFVYNNSLGQDASGLHLCSVGNLTHQRPVLDAEGVPIHEGDTVWCIGGGEPAEVAYTIEADASHPDEVVLKGYEDDWPVNADMLTHTKSEPPDTRASVITGLDEETIRRIDKLVMDGRWLDD